MKLGVNLWTVYGWRPPEPISVEVFKALSDMGAQGVELIIDEANNPAEMWLSKQESWKSLFQEIGLEIPSVATTLFWQYNLASQDKAKRERGIEVGQAGCRVAQAFGAQVFLIVAGVQEPNTDYQISYKNALNSIRTMADYAESLGITIGIENVPSNFLCSPGEYAQFIADVRHPAVKAYLDFANGAAIGNGFPENWIKAVGDSTAIVHAKDRDQGLNAFVCCGQGDLQWDDIFRALQEVHYDGYLIIENPPRGGQGIPNQAAGLSAAQTSLNWLSRYFT